MKKPPDLARSSSTRTTCPLCSVFTIRPSVARGMFMREDLEMNWQADASLCGVLACCGQQGLQARGVQFAQVVEKRFHRVGQRALLRPARGDEVGEATQLAVGKLVQ